MIRWLGRPQLGHPRGQALAEFALAIPIFLIIALGLFDLGRYVVAQNSITNATREGARLAIVNQTQASIEARVEALTFTGAPTTYPTLYFFAYPDSPAADDDDDLFFDDNGDGIPDDLADDERCYASPSSGQRRISIGCVALVRASTTMTPITPVVGTLVGSITLRAASMLPVEFVCPNSLVPAYATSGDCPKQP